MGVWDSVLRVGRGGGGATGCNTFLACALGGGIDSLGGGKQLRIGGVGKRRRRVAGGRGREFGKCSTWNRRGAVMARRQGIAVVSSASAANGAYNSMSLSEIVVWRLSSGSSRQSKLGGG